jgi:uncharacterized protein with GYD domain
MAIRIGLVSFTEQGIRGIKDSPQRAKAFRELAKKKGVTVRDIFWCTGRYDMVVITEGEEAAQLAALLSIAKLGNVRTETLGAMDAETFQRVLEQVQ